MIEAKDIDNIRKLISSGDLAKALTILVDEGDRKGDFYDSIIQISGRYNSLDNKFSRNIITSNDYNQELNQIRAYVLNTLREIEESQKEKIDLTEVQVESASEDRKDNLIAQLVSEENLDEAIEELRKWIKEKEEDPNYINEAAIIFSQYTRLKKDITSGTISASDTRVESAMIKSAILDLVNRIINAPKKEKEEKEKQEQIEESAASFVQESILALTKREKNLKIQAITWYIIGFLSLVAGVWVAIDYINFNTIDTDSVIKVVYQIFKSLFVVGLLVAASRYAFNLGKTYMNEALKNADRIHAISFGKFYLQVFGTNIKSEDLKEVFKEWNTVQESSFVKLNSEDFDPKMIDAIVKMLHVLKNKE